MITGDVIFKGSFELANALSDFQKFATAIEERMGLMTRRIQQKANQKTEDRVLELMGINEKAMASAEAKVNAFRRRVQEAVDKGLIDPQRAVSVTQSVENRITSLANRVERLNYKVQENIAFTKADILALRQINAELNTFEKRTAMAERQLATTNLRIQESAKRFNQFFQSTVIGGFALQQLGTFLTYNLTMPIIRAGKEIALTTMRFDTLETLMRERGNRSLGEIAESLDLVGRTAKLRNFDLEAATTLYSRLFEATRGAIDDQVFEKVSKGLSQVMTTIESGEKRAFFGQIQDVLAGGDVANLDKTLSLAPLLKTVYDEIEKSTKGALSQQEILIKAFERLSTMPAINDLQTKVKNLRVQFELWGARIGRIYRDDLEKFVTFIETRVFPAFEKLLQYFEKLSPWVQNALLIVVGLTAAIGPLTYVLGTLGVVMGGIAYVARAASLGIAAMTGSSVAAKFAAADLTTLLASSVASGGAFGKVAAFLPRVVGLLNPVTLGITLAAAALVGIGSQSDSAKASLDGLVGTVSGGLTKALSSLSSVLELVSLGIQGLVLMVEDFGKTRIGQFIGEILSGLLQLLTLAVMPLEQALGLLSATLESIARWLSSGSFNKGWQMFKLRLMELQDEIIEALPWFLKFEQWLERVFEKESPRKQALKDQKALVGELTAETNKNIYANQKVAISQSEVTKTTLKAAQAIKTLTDAIEDQNKKLREQQYNLGKAQYMASQDVVSRSTEQQISSLDEIIGQSDLSDVGQRAAAMNRVLQANRLAMANAQRDADNRMLEEYNNLWREQREKLYDMAVKEDNAAMQQFYSRATNLYDTYANNREKLFPALGDLLKQYISDPVINQQAGAIAAYFENQKQQYKVLGQIQAATQKEILDAREANQKRIDDFNKKVKDANQQQIEFNAEQTALGLTGSAEDNIRALERTRQRLIDDKENVQDINQFAQEIRRIEADIIVQLTAIRDAELQKVEVSGETFIEQQRRRAEINRQFDDAVKNLQEETGDSISDKIKEGLDKQKSNQKALLEVILSYRDYAQSGINLIQEVASLTGRVDMGSLKRQIELFNEAINTVVEHDAVDGYTKFGKISDTLAKIAQQNPGEAGKTIAGFLETVGKAMSTQGAYTDEKMLTGMIDQARLVSQWLQWILANYKFADDVEKANFQNAIEGYTQFIEGIRRQRDLLTSKTGLELESLQADQAKIDYQIRVNDLQREELEIVEQIAQIRKDRGYAIDLKGLKTFATDLLDVLSGGQKTLSDIQEKILRREMEANRLEVESAVIRLQIEQRILEMKIQASDMAQADKDRMIAESRQQSEELIEHVKKQGELQGELLQEQIDSLNRFGGSIGQIIIGSIMSAMDGVFGKKKKVTQEVGIDANLDGIDVGEDPNLDLSPTFDTDEVDEQTASLGKLEGKYKAVASAVGAAAKAIMSMNDLSIKSIRNAVAEALNAIAQEAAVKALQYAAIALSAAVFGDWGTAGRAAVAAAAWGGVAIAAKLGADLIGTGDQQSVSNSTTAAARQGGSLEKQTERDILRQQALSVAIELKMEIDEGIIMRKNIKALNQNTPLSNIVLNSQESWAYSPSV